MSQSDRNSAANSLAGKRAVITGGGSGIGADMAVAFAKEGAEVTITGRREATLQAVAEQYDGIRAAVVDVTDEASMVALFENIGSVDIVIANAGAAESAPFTKTSFEQWQRMLNVNLSGVFLTLREGLKQLNDGGRLIAVASTAGLKGYAYVGAYCAAKHGVVGLVRSLAAETATRDMTVNALCPGFTDTPLLAASVENIVTKTGQSAEQATAHFQSTNPTGRLVTPAEVTATALWLCGPNSGAINGQAISISGGEV
ncbi:Short-chain dehydrogenase/reductase SDR [Halomonas sp. A3H3]|uniref:SDR family NAD(P)-dependent oxidoreductase n=1 Tax=Halomonadaceae TaxID=28256 RepID=UPI00038CA7A7|nr:MULTISPECIES: SDR family NAD(P)-dependent oxidoreductase [Halomonas]CDG51032.1 Short-chain dehydrogenase/reductase SDR [Halomonas sp. A3H3]SDI97518.1 NAD(P)-dependent dehydrogenase, short-chain alcohol dehydrogenase family [Halomonas titanicae]|tara:strand:- start:51 stop:821 length:771 start_codon:yes stop_codon:yes gene_type:complete